MNPTKEPLTPESQMTEPRTSRRTLLANTGVVAAGAVALLHAQRVEAGSPVGYPVQAAAGAFKPRALSPGMPNRDYQPVIVPNGTKCPWKIVGGVKVFHLVAEEFEHEFAPGLKALCWGYNKQVNGPVLEMVEGDHIRVYLTNRLIAPTTVHWHGFLLPNGMDGVGGLNQRAVRPNETYLYEFVVAQHGTLMFHSHHDEMTQMALGLMGMIVLHPRRPTADYRVDRDFAMLLSEWFIPMGAKRPDPNAMSNFNMLTINAKAFPGTAPLVVKKGDRVRFRIGNLSAMDHHPIHLHGHFFRITATDGGPIPLSAQWPESTVLVAVGSTRDVEFVADAPGDWAMHCHMTHHVMNQMGHGIPNMIGVKPGKLDQNVQRLLPGYMTMGQDGMGDMADMKMPVPENSVPMVGGAGPFGTITMGGMFTILKVREGLTAYDKDPGWYKNPPGTVADVASAADLARDGIQNPAPTPSQIPGKG